MYQLSNKLFKSTTITNHRKGSRNIHYYNINPSLFHHYIKKKWNHYKFKFTYDKSFVYMY